MAMATGQHGNLMKAKLEQLWKSNILPNVHVPVHHMKSVTILLQYMTGIC